MKVLQLLEQRGVKARVSGGTLWVCCPFCTFRGTTPDTRYRLGIALGGGGVRKGVGRCFNCQYRSRDTLKDILGDDGTLLAAAVQAVANAPVQKKVVERVLPDDFELLEFGARDPWMRKAEAFLKERHVAPWQIRKYGLGLSLSGRTAYRVVVPVWDGDYRKTQGWTARTLVGNEPKWLHSKGLSTVFRAGTPGSGEVILVEGVMDALAVERSVEDAAVWALFGTNLTATKMQILRDTGLHYVSVWLDSDRAGQRATVDVAEKLVEGGFGVRVVRMLGDGKDPGDASPDQIRAAFQDRREYTQSIGLRMLAGLTLQGNT